MTSLDRISGVVLSPGDSDFDSARTVWNAMVERKPRLIVRCAGPADVAAAIRHARDNDLEIGVRCGGHSVVGHAIPDVPDDATAFSHRDTFVEFVSASRWADAAEDEMRMAAGRRYGAAMAPHASGVYVNALTDEGSEGVRRAYSPEKMVRLTALKDAWDPDNVFHLNHNIPPSRA